MARCGGSLIVQGGRRYLDCSHSDGRNTCLINKKKTAKIKQNNQLKRDFYL